MRKIVIPESRESAYRIAGEAFQELYRKVTGQELPLIREDDGESDLIIIGSDAVNDVTANLFADMKITSLEIRYGTDDYAMRSVDLGDRMALVLAGGCGRSTLYAVYDYFERVAGCRYFWDGDVIPHRDDLPLNDLIANESPRFEYRGLRYFAHRGLHRFQAEHWSFEDWKQEIDWVVKRRMNYFMLRIGMDDLFQRAFPDTVSYPDATKPFPDEEISWAKGPKGAGYDDRSLFWSLEYRGKLREQVLAYATERGLQFSTDCGTMTHWYSRTPLEFLDKKNPKFLGQADNQYAQRNGLCWDPRVRENLENYLKLTEADCEAYGGTKLFHTIGLAERKIMKDRAGNFNLKLFTYRRIMQGIRERYPDSKMMIASWDFLMWWHPEEVQALIEQLDPNNTMILDYTSEGDDPDHSFLNWGIVGKFPWIFGLFHAYERESSIRGPYDLSRERLEVAKNDPYCKGMIFWPELSHSDTLVLEYLARNSWQPEETCIETLAESFSTDRYGSYAKQMNEAWQAYLPMVKRFAWGGFSDRDPSDPDYAKYAYEGATERYGNYWADMLNLADTKGLSANTLACWTYECKRQNEAWDNAGKTLDILAKLPTEAYADPFILRDVVDIARSLLEQRIHHGIMSLLCGIEAFKKGANNADALKQQMDALMTALHDHLEIIGCHEDYSMGATLNGLNKVAPVNPSFEVTLKRNLVNGYCRQAAYEPCKALYLLENEAFYNWVRKNLDADIRGPWEWTLDGTENELYDAFMATPLSAIQPICDPTLLPQLLSKAASDVKQIALTL